MLQVCMSLYEILDRPTNAAELGPEAVDQFYQLAL
jgi:hypothetical protein